MHLFSWIYDIHQIYFKSALHYAGAETSPTHLQDQTVADEINAKLLAGGILQPPPDEFGDDLT